MLPEADSAKAQQAFADVLGQGGRLIVLDLAFAEATNAIWKWYHLGTINLAQARQYLKDVLQCKVQVEPARGVLVPALEIAAKYQRAVYDALFVALAQDLGLKGVTAGEPLYKAVHADFPDVVLLRDW